MTSLDVESVQAFVLVADLRSFTKAADVMETSQAAVSVKLKRLEQRLGQQLIERTPRLVRVSARGAAFLDAARQFLAAHERALAGLSPTPHRVKFGISDHVAGPELPELLARLHEQDPNLTIEVHIDSSRALMQSFDDGLIDAAIVRREDGRRKGEVLAQEPFGWFASPAYLERQAGPIRLASLADSCSVRGAATRLLDAARIRWSEVFVGGGTAALIAAVSAGLAVAPLAFRVAPYDVIEVGERLGLPELPLSVVTLHSHVSDSRSKAVVRTLGAAFRERSASKRI